MALALDGKRKRIRMPAEIPCGSGARTPTSVVWRATLRSGEAYDMRMKADEASERVRGILDAAERAAGQLREQAEARALERIAEADRAVENRVGAAEEEAREIVAQARAQAEQATDEAQRHSEATLAAAREEAERMRSSAAEQARQKLAGGEQRLAVERAEAEEKASEMRARARGEAREIVGDAHAIAREVMRDGEEISRNMRDLSASLRNNAERLLRDVRLTHGSMTARLDQAAPGAEPRSRSSSEPDRERGALRGSRRAHDDPDDLDVPEFIPRG
jgi:vacuolar-type H+-ATPase subunit H